MYKKKDKSEGKPEENSKEKANTVADELRLALWFIGKIGDPLRARQVLNAAVGAVGVAARPTDKNKLEKIG